MLNKKYLIAIGIVCCILFILSFSKNPVQKIILAPTPTLTPSIPKLYGVNMSGAEFGDKSLPGILGKDYIYPQDIGSYSYFQSKGLTLIRLPIRWERIQNTAFGPLSTIDTAQILTVLQIAHTHHMQVIIDLHNYGRYYNVPLASSAMLSDVWTKLATLLVNQPGLYGYELMNEPHDLPGGTDSWATIAQQVTTAIRQVDSSHSILIPGYSWQNAQNWSGNNPHLLINDPSNNIIYTSHVYFDSTYQGLYAKSIVDDHATTNRGITYTKNFLSWLAKNHAKGMFTEFGVPADANWLSTLNVFLQNINNNPSIIGATYWSAGPWWGTYPLSIQPSENQDMPQMQILEKYL